MASIKDHKGYNQGFERTQTFNIRIERRANMIMSKMNNTNSRSLKILEIGCGTGEISNYLAINTNGQIKGIDICKPFIDIAKKEFNHSNLEYEVKDFFDYLSQENEKFDYIVGNGILHHLYNNLDDSLNTLNKMLKSKGKIIFMEPNIYNPYCYLIFNYLRGWANLDPDEMAFSKRFISDKLRKNNYSEIEVIYKDFLLPNTPIFLVKSVIAISDLLEKIFPVNRITQSIFISASK